LINREHWSYYCVDEAPEIKIASAVQAHKKFKNMETLTESFQEEEEKPARHRFSVGGRGKNYNFLVNLPNDSARTTRREYIACPPGTAA
jgi:hypothetical protein